MRASAHRLLTVLLVCCALTAATASDAAPKPVAAGRSVTVRTVHTLANVPLADAAAVLRGFATRPDAVTVDEARRVLEVDDTAERMPRLLRLIQAMELARAGDRVWVEHVHGSMRPSEYAKRLDDLFAPDPGARSGPVARIVGDDEAGVLVIVADESTFLRIAEQLHRAPSGSSAPGKVLVLPLRHAGAEDVAHRLRPMVEHLQRSLDPKAAATQVTADVATNSIVITSSPVIAAALRKAALEMDVPPGKVLLEIAIAEAPASAGSPDARDPVGAVLDRVRLLSAEPVNDEERRMIWTTRDPRVVERRVLLTREAATNDVRVDVRGGFPSPGGEWVRGYRIAVSARGRAPSNELRLDIHVAACTRPGAPCAGRASQTLLVLRDAQTVVLRTMERDRVRPGPAPGTERASLFVVLTPHWIRDEEIELPRLVSQRQIEREEARDDEALFHDASGLPPLRVHRGSRGIVGEIRRAQREIEAGEGTPKGGLK